MATEDDDSLFSPANAKMVAFALELLIAINVIAIELAIAVYLIIVADPGYDLGALASAIQRAGADSNIFTRIFMLSGILFFSLFYAFWIWLYRGAYRFQWFAGGLGYLLSTASMIAFKYRARQDWLDNEELYPWLVFGAFTFLASSLVIYAIYSLTRTRVRLMVLLVLGALILLTVMPVCYVVDSSGVAPVVFQLLGMIFFIFTYVWFRRTTFDPPSTEAEEPLLAKP